MFEFKPDTGHTIGGVTEGVVPLICAACNRIVGVINARAFNKNEPYICKTCRAHTPILPYFLIHYPLSLGPLIDINRHINVKN